MPLSPNPIVSIIIPVFNQLVYTQGCVDSLVSVDETTPFEIIIIDNGSTDGTAEYLAGLRQRFGESCRVVSFSENRGYAEANNRGCEVARGEFVALLNNDTLVTPDWLSSLVRMVQQPRVGIVGPKLVFPATETINHAGYAYNLDQAIFYPIYAHQPANLPHLGRALEVQALLGACILMRTSLYRDVGGMHYLGLEDIDFCLRVRKAGYRIVWAPESVVYHYGSVTLLGSVAGSLPEMTNQEFSRRWPQSDLQGDDLQRYERDGYVFDSIGADHVKVNELLIDVYRYLAEAYTCLGNGDSNKAEENLARALEIHPRNAEVLVELLRLPRVQQCNEASLDLARMAVTQGAHSEEVLREAAGVLGRYAMKHRCSDTLREAQGVYSAIIENDLFPEVLRELAASELAKLQF